MLRRRFRGFALIGALALVPAVASAESWASFVTMSAIASNTLGRLCTGIPNGVGKYFDIACPSYAPSMTTAGDISVTGNLSAAQFLGDGSQLTGVTASGVAWDDIISIPDQVQQVSSSGSITMASVSASTLNSHYLSSTQGYIGTLTANGAGIGSVNATRVSVTNDLNTLYLSATTAYLGTASVGSLLASGIVTASFYEGDGSRLTNLPAGIASAVAWDNIISIPNQVQQVSSSGSITMASVSASTLNSHYLSSTQGTIGSLTANAAGIGSMNATRVSVTNDLNTLYLSATTAYAGRLDGGVVSATTINGHYASFTTLTAGSLYGDGSGLTGITADATDRITSGTTRMVVVSDTGYVSLTQAGTNTGWFSPYTGLVTLGVSATGPISGSGGYFYGSVGIGTVPSAILDVVGGSGRSRFTASNNGRIIEFNPANGSIDYFHNGGATSGGYFYINRTNNSHHILLNPEGTGRVGIGTLSGTAPNATLEVNGAVSATNLRVANIVTASFYEGDGSRLTNLPAGVASAVAWDNIISIPNQVQQVSSSGSIAMASVSASTLNSHYLSSTQGTIGSLTANAAGIGSMNATRVSVTNDLNTLYLSATTAYLGTASVGSLLASGIVTASFYEGDGSRLTNLNASSISGLATDRITSGTTNITAHEDTSLTFTTAGSERMVVGEDGNVGIGTATPSNFAGHLNLTLGTGYSGANLDFVSASTRVAYIVKNQYGMNMGTADALPFAFHSNSSERMRIDADGNVGIGTTAPSVALDVSGTVSATALNLALVSGSYGLGGDTGVSALNDLSDVDTSGAATGSILAYDGAGWVVSSTDTNTAEGDRIVSGTTNILANEDTSLTFTTAGSQRMVIGEDGNVGIGTTNPFTKLDVVGASQASTAANSGSGNMRITTGTGANTDEQLVFGVHDGDYSWIQAVKPGSTNRNLSLNPNGGNVGIGTTAPGSQFSVSGTGIARLGGQSPRLLLEPAAFDEVNRMWSIDNAQNGTLRFYTTDFSATGVGANPIVNMILTSTSALGIGHSYGVFPKAKLDVNGTISASGAIQVGTSSLSCSSSISGSLRYSITSSTVEYCDATTWRDLGDEGSVAYMRKSLSAEGSGYSTGSTIAFNTVKESRGSGIASSGNSIILDPGSSYMLMANVRIQGPSTILDYQIYDETNADYIGSRGSANSNAGYSDVGAVFFVTPAVATTYSVRVPGLAGAPTALGNSWFAAMKLGGGANGTGGGGASVLDDLTDVNTSGASTGNILAYNGSNWVVSSTDTNTAEGDRIVSGTLSMIANSPTSYISLSTAGTTWGYFHSVSSYLPQLVSERVSSTDISASIVDMSANTVSNIAGGGGNFIASGTTSISASNAGNLKFATGGSQRMVIDAGGNVGIGATGPIGKLVSVKNSGNSGAAALHVAAEGTGQSQKGGVAFYSTFETTGDNGPRRAADILAGYSGGAWGNEYLAFLVGGSDDTARLGSERMRIRANGTVGIGTSSPDQGRVEVKGGTVCVDTDSDNNASSCIASESDARLKQNVKPLENSLEKIIQLQGVSFDWKVSDSEVLKHYPLISRFKDNPHSIGLIAQDVQRVVPEAIEGETIGDDEVQYLQLDYTKLVPHLINGMKELKGANDNLRAIVREQGNQIDELKALVKASAKP